MRTDITSDRFGMVRRNSKEAVDAGILLWRENFIFFLPFFAIPLWSCAFLLRVFLPENYQYFSWFIIWLSKPLFDRTVIHVISIRFFERDANIKRLCRGIWKTLFRGLLGDLTWRRFSPLRSAMMPMRLLERNLKPGKLTRERKKHLKNGSIGDCFYITIWGIAVEIALLTGVFLFFVTINELMFGGRIQWESVANIEIYIYAVWCINYILIETIYVCMGFSLYINSRIAIEGWDIELKFRNFAKKLKEKSGYLASVILLVFCLFSPISAHAEDFPYETLQKVLESTDFGGEKETWSIRFKNPPDDVSEPLFNYLKLIELLNRVREFFASSLRTIIFLLIAAFIIFLLISLRKINWRKRHKTGDYTANVLQNKITEDPASLLEKALAFSKQNNIRLAWGYCTAAAIQSWQTYRGILFPPNATENDCANIVNTKTNGSSEAKSFSALIKDWIYLAYAEIIPPEERFEEAVAFCISLRKEDG